MAVPRSHLMIYLAPDLEKKSQEQNNFIVAHEFAHAALNHGTWEWLIQNSDSTEYLDRDDEIAADNLVKQWGYPVPAASTRDDEGRPQNELGHNSGHYRKCAAEFCGRLIGGKINESLALR